MIGICLDITGNKKAEESLRESENRERSNAAEMQAVMDLAPVAIWIAHDPLCLRITGNKYADEIFNVSRKSNISASAPPGEAAVTYKVFQKGKELKAEELPAQMAASTGKPVKAEMMDLVFSDGRVITMIEGSTPLFDAEGRVRGSVTAGSDLSRLLHVKKELRESEERYRELVQSSPEAVIVHSDGEFLYANPAALRLYGAQSIDQLREKTILDLIPEDERAIIAARMKQ
jgi:PAS domain-containing protein